MTGPFLEIGVVCRPHGLRGAVRVKLHDPASLALEFASQLWVEKSPDGFAKWRLLRHRREREGLFVLEIEGLSDRSAAGAWCGRKLFASRDDLPALEPGEFYLAELPGCEVLLEQGEKIGVVGGVSHALVTPHLVIERPGRAPALVPVISDFVLSYDAELRQLVITPPEGLLDIDQPGST